MMEITTVTRPSANDEGVCGMFMNLFRRQRPALARLARNSNSYQHPMAKAVNSSPMTSATSATSTLDAAISQVHNIPVVGTLLITWLDATATSNGWEPTRVRASS